MRSSALQENASVSKNDIRYFTRMARIAREMPKVSREIIVPKAERRQSDLELRGAILSRRVFR